MSSHVQKPIELDGDQLKIINALEQLLGPPEGKIIVVRGPSGSGKTEVAHRFFGRHPARNGNVPAVYVSSPITASRRAFYSAILLGLGDPMGDAPSTASTKERRFRILSVRLGTQLLVLDNAEDLLGRWAYWQEAVPQLLANLVT